MDLIMKKNIIYCIRFVYYQRGNEWTATITNGEEDCDGNVGVIVVIVVVVGAIAGVMMNKQIIITIITSASTTAITTINITKSISTTKYAAITATTRDLHYDRHSLHDCYLHYWDYYTITLHFHS